MRNSFPQVRIGVAALFAIAVVVAGWRDFFREKKNLALRGTIELLDTDNRVLVVRSGESSDTHRFVWNENTRFCDIEGNIMPRDAKPGQRVLVIYKTQRRALMAARIEIEPVYGECDPIIAKGTQRC